MTNINLLDASKQITDDKFVTKLSGSSYKAERMREDTFDLSANQSETIFPASSSIVSNVWDKVSLLSNDEVKSEIKVILYSFVDAESKFKNISNSAASKPLHISVENQDNVLLEWIFEDFRLGFDVSNTPEGSTWFYVTNEKFGLNSLCGYLDDIDIPSFVLGICLIAFTQL